MNSFRPIGNYKRLDWDSLRPAEHFVQIYEDDADLIDKLEAFALSGLRQDECVVIIATAEHIGQLGTRLSAADIDLKAAADDGRYIVRDASYILDDLLDGGWPDDDAFERIIEEIIEEAGCKDRSVRAFGELVALLWADGRHAATLRLESLWSKYSNKYSFALFHAYPRKGFTDFHLKSLSDIHDLHSHVID